LTADAPGTAMAAYASHSLSSLKQWSLKHCYGVDNLMVETKKKPGIKKPEQKKAGVKKG
jgi:hypothetical protein